MRLGTDATTPTGPRSERHPTGRLEHVRRDGTSRSRPVSLSVAASRRRYSSSRPETPRLAHRVAELEAGLGVVLLLEVRDVAANVRALTPRRLALTGSEWPSISIRIVIARCSLAMSCIIERSVLVNGAGPLPGPLEDVDEVGHQTGLADRDRDAQVGARPG